MQLNIWTCLSLFTISFICESSIINVDKPLHIGVSINFASRSHIIYLLEILQVLAEKGHQITYLSMNEMKKFGNDYNVTHYSLGDVEIFPEMMKNTIPFTSKDSLFKGIKDIGHLFHGLYEISLPSYENFYSKEKPDLMICDLGATSCIDSAVKNTIPIMIGFQSLMFSSPTPFLTISGIFDPPTIENFSFLQRMKHAIIDPIQLIREYLPIVNVMSPLRERYSVPASAQFTIPQHLGLSIVNSYIGFESPRNIPSNVQVIGPILSDQIPNLPEDLELFLNKHSKVLYIAFGSLVQLIPDLINNLLLHFQKALNEGVVDGILWGGLANTDLNTFPKTYIVDYKEYSTQSILYGTHENIQLMKWAPQESILNHPNTKLFLSHGGLDSVYESLSSSTPMLILPFIADQARNGMLIAENGVGDYIEWPTMSDEVIYQKFVKLLDPNNIELKSKLHQMQLITKFSSKRKVMAADLIETYALSAKICRLFEPAIPFEIPCEMKPYLPLDNRMSFIEANLIDVYITAFFLFSITLLGVIYAMTKIFFKLLNMFITKSQIRFNSKISNKSKND